MKKLSTEHPFFEFMGNIGDLMILNVLFLITSIPVVTIGMSMTVMYKIILRRMRGESCYVIREYFRECGNEWRQSTKLWGLFVVTGGLLLFDILYSKNLPGALNIAIGILAVLWCFVAIYAFPLQARFHNSIKNTLKNALLLSLQNLPATLIMVLLNSIPVICIVAGVFVTMIAMPIFCVIGFSLTARINGIFLSGIFRKIENRENKE